MSTRKPILETLGEHKTAIILAIVIITGGSIGTYFILDSLNAQDPDSIILATTTSTYDSGLLDYILPKFTAATGIQVSVLSVGTGTAIQYGKDGNADVILVHSRSREDDFVNSSLGVNNIAYGIHRTCVMYNDFIIVGPSGDPAGLNNGDNVSVVMNKLNTSMNAGDMTFYSRGDNSGTHSKEELLWAVIGITDPSTYWGDTSKYAETGQGMGDTLQVTSNDVDGYTLIDKGTWLANNDTYTLMDVLASSVLGEDYLLNPYGAIPVNPIMHPNVKYISVSRFIGFLTSDYGQALINNHKRNGEVLFTACFGNCNATHNCVTTDEEIPIWTPFQEEYATLTV